MYAYELKPGDTFTTTGDKKPRVVIHATNDKNSFVQWTYADQMGSRFWSWMGGLCRVRRLAQKEKFKPNMVLDTQDGNPVHVHAVEGNYRANVTLADGTVMDVPMGDLYPMNEYYVRKGKLIRKEW